MSYNSRHGYLFLFVTNINEVDLLKLARQVVKVEQAHNTKFI